MEAPGNGQCYCYAIMSSLCFPCQVKVHLLHLTASPHGELITSLRSQSPVDETRPIPDSPRKWQSHSHSPDNETSSFSPDCDKCDDYMKFIDKLTSGLCDENILRLVHSNPCLVSTDAPNPPGAGGAIKNEFSTSNSNQPYFGVRSAARESETQDPHPLKDDMYPKWSTKRHSSEDANAKEQSLFQSNKKCSTTSTNNPLKQKLEKNSDEKPTTPIELMTTDKMLRRSFESIAKNRLSRIPSRSPSPAKKTQLHTKSGTVIKTARANVECVLNSHKQATALHRIPAVQATSRDTAPTKWLRNRKSSPLALRKDEPNQQLKKSGNPEKAKHKSKEVSKRTPPPHSEANAKKLSKTHEPTTDRPIKSNGEVREWHPGMGYTMDEQAKVPQKHREGQGSKHIFGMGRVDGNTSNRGFFEADLVMDFYQPPQLGPGHIGRDSLKRLINEYENEPSNADLGGGVVKQFCGKPNRSSVKKECFNQANDLDKIRDSREIVSPTNGMDNEPVADDFKIPTGRSKRAKSNSDQRSYELSNLDQAKERFKGTAYSPGNAGSRRVSGESAASEECDDDSKNATTAGKYDKNPKIPLKGINEYENEPANPYLGGGVVKQFCGKPNRSSVTKEGFNHANNLDKIRYSREIVSPTNVPKYEEDKPRKSKQTELTTGRKHSITGSASISTAEHVLTEQIQMNEDRFENQKNFWASNDIVMDNERVADNFKVSAGKSEWAKSYSVQRRYELSNLDQAKESSKGTAYSPGNASSRRVSGESAASGERNDDSKNATSAGKYDKAPKIRRKGINQSDSGSCDRQRDDGQYRQARTSCDTSEGLFYADYTDLSEQNHENPRISKVERDLCDIAEYFNEQPPGAKDYRRYANFKDKDTDYDVKRLNRKRIVCKSMSDSRSHSDDKSPENPNQIKSKSPNRHRRSGSGTSGDYPTRVHPQFSEYMSPDSEGFKSKSTGNVVDSLTDPLDVTHPGSSRWDCGICPDDAKLVHTNKKCTPMAICLPQHGRNSNPHIRMDRNKHIKKEMMYYRADKSVQKNGYWETGTQYDTEFGEETSPNPSRPATAKNSKNRFPPKTNEKFTQSSQGQMYYNRPLKRRSFL